MLMDEKEREPTRGLKFVIGPNVWDDFKVYLDGKVVTDLLRIKSISMSKVSMDQPMAVVNLECYTQCIEVIGHRADVDVKFDIPKCENASEYTGRDKPVCGCQACWTTYQSNKRQG